MTNTTTAARTSSRQAGQPPATLATIDRGVSRLICKLAVGEYIWHRGAFRRVTAVNGRTVRMGRYALHSDTCPTVEAAPPGA